MYEITQEVIEADIRAFEARINQAKRRLEALPKGRLSYADHKKREKQRRELNAEIRHVQRLIGYAKETLSGP